MVTQKHHYVFGTLKDLLTGETVDDTHDERYRQSIAQILLTDKGFERGDIRSGVEIAVKAGDRKAAVGLDFLVAAGGKTCMIIRYGPGSLTTRHRPGLAASRLAAPWQVPVVVITNGKEVDVLDGKTGEISGRGFAAIPDKPALEAMGRNYSFSTLPPKRLEMESRILYTYDVEGRCQID